MANVAKDFAQLISQSKSNKTGPYDTQATVKRVEGNTVWVSIPGGVDETPIDKTVNCTAGDKVQVRVSGGRAWITGNASAPPTDDKTANEAKGVAVIAQTAAVDAKETADAVEGIAVSASATAVTAKTIAEGVNEHFWHDNTGAHVTEVTQEEWNEPTDPNYHSGGNTLITTQGMAIRNGLTNLAEFGASGAQIGQTGGYNSRLEIGTDALKIIKSNGNNPEILMTHLGYGTTKYNSSTMPGPFYTLGSRAAGDIGYYSVAEGSNVIASGIYSHAENHATASGSYSHAEGEGTASGSEAHAEGSGTTASGSYSHAEGSNTVASAIATHASGGHTIAQRNYQTVIGTYNVADTGENPGALGDFVFMIGNGSSDNARSNALTVKWSGDVEAAGDIEDGSGNVLSNKLEASSLVVDTDISIADNISVSSGQVSDGNTSIAKTGYTPLGVVGYRVVNASSSGANGNYGVISHAYITGNTAYYRVRNTGSATMKVRIYFNILYVKS